MWPWSPGDRFSFGVLVTSVLCVILWAKRSFVCHLSAYARAHKRLHCGRVNMFKWQMMSPQKRCRVGLTSRADEPMFLPLSKSQSAHIPSVSCQSSYSALSENWIAFSPTNALWGTKWKIICHNFLHSVIFVTVTIELHFLFKSSCVLLFSAETM